MLKLKFVFNLILCLIIYKSYTQNTNGFRYQSVLRDSLGNVYSSKQLPLLLEIRKNSVNGTLIWQEIHQIKTDDNGYFSLIIGKGTNTGMGTANYFDNINWSDSVYYLKLLIDTNNSGTFYELGNTSFFSVPYAFYSDFVLNPKDSFLLSSLKYVDTSGNNYGKFLMWNGKNFNPVFINIPDSSLFSSQSNNSNSSDTSFFSYNILNKWKLKGNSGYNNFLGLHNKGNLVLKTNNKKRLIIDSIGNIIINVDTLFSSFQIYAKDNFLFTGNLNTGSILDTNQGIKFYWIPSKAALRIGYSDTLWTNSKIKNYSVVFGYNSNAGENSIATGLNCLASGRNSVAMGRNCQALATGINQYGTSVALGDSCIASALRTACMGVKCYVSATTCIALGYKAQAIYNVATSIGYNTIASGAFSSALGYYANTNAKNGSFIFADASSQNYFLAPAQNTFSVKASGATVFYTDTAMTMGVILFPGSGSWSNVSDINKKENIKKINDSLFINNINKLNIYKWEYITQKKIKHIGPMAQDLYYNFHFGESKENINTLDLFGINLYYSKIINEKMKLLDKKINKIDTLKNIINEIDFNALNQKMDLLIKKQKNKL